jgi:hypothetical protein
VRGTEMVPRCRPGKMSAGIAASSAMRMPNPSLYGLDAVEMLRFGDFCDLVISSQMRLGVR